MNIKDLQEYLSLCRRLKIKPTFENANFYKQIKKNFKLVEEGII